MYEIKGVMHLNPLDLFFLGNPLKHIETHGETWEYLGSLINNDVLFGYPTPRTYIFQKRYSPEKKYSTFPGNLETPNP